MPSHGYSCPDSLEQDINLRIIEKSRGHLSTQQTLIGLHDMSWRRLQYIFISVTIFRLPRRLEDVLKTCWRCFGDEKLLCWRRLQEPSRHVLKTSWRHVLKTSWRNIFKTSWRCLGDKQNVYWGYLYITNLNLYLTNLYLTNIYLTNLWWIQNT